MINMDENKAAELRHISNTIRDALATAETLIVNGSRFDLLQLARLAQSLTHVRDHLERGSYLRDSLSTCILMANWPADAAWAKRAWLSLYDALVRESGQ